MMKKKILLLFKLKVIYFNLTNESKLTKMINVGNEGNENFIERLTNINESSRRAPAKLFALETECHFNDS